MYKKSKIEYYIDVKKRLQELKEVEMSLRKEIVNEALAQGVMNGAIVHISCTLKLARKNTTSLITEVLDNLTLTSEEAKCITWKPSLKMANYKKLSEGNQLKQAVQIKPAAPTITIVENNDGY